MRNLIFIVSFILVSFGVGVSLGLSRSGTPQAFAKNYPSVGEQISLFPAPELNLTPIGSGGEINDKVSQLYSLTSESSVGDIVASQEKRWKDVGLTTSQKSTAQRAVVIGVNHQTREMYQMVLFFCPPTVRERLCSGQNVYGMISKMGEENSSKGNSMPFTICSGGKQISSFAASDLGHPSLTATYICPSSPESVASELDSEFVAWEKREDSTDILVYSKDEEQLTIIPSGKDGKTLLVVTYQRGV
jgi:hypothetical protein